MWLRQLALGGVWLACVSAAWSEPSYISDSGPQPKAVSQALVNRGNPVKSDPEILGSHDPNFIRWVPQHEARLLEHLRSNPEVTDIYALFSTGYYQSDGNFFIVVDRDGAELRHHSPSSRQRSRRLSKSETEDLQSFVTRNKLNKPMPEQPKTGLATIGGGHGPHYQFLQLNREGGRRLPFIPVGEPYTELFERFTRLADHDMVTHHEVVKAVPTAKVLVSGGDKRTISRVRGWQGDLYVCLTTPDTGVGFVNAYTGRKVHFGSDPKWCKVEGNELRQVTRPPWLPQDDSEETDRLPTSAATERGKIQVTEAGLSLIDSGRQSLLDPGEFRSIIASSDGRWICASRSWTKEKDIVLIDVRTAEMIPSKVELDSEQLLVPLAFVEPQDSFLVFQAQMYRPGIGRFLLVATDGTSRPIQGQLEPFLDALDRPLQPSQDQAFWAAVPSDDGTTDIGTIDKKTLQFHPRATFPGVSISSSEIWVDETAQGVYAASDGDLLWLPLPAP